MGITIDFSQPTDKQLSLIGDIEVVLDIKAPSDLSYKKAEKFINKYEKQYTKEHPYIRFNENHKEG